jgi:putative nucleotidyltransferase with HDIG domain
MQKLSLTELINKVEKLPELPQVAMRLNRMMEDPNVSANQLAEVMRLDANMTGQALRLCNSASFGLPRKIETVREAVAMMGFKAIKSMIYTIIAHSALERPVGGYNLGQGALWFNSLTCAVYAKYLAEEFDYPDSESAFTAGLLRDIGKLVLGEYVGANYEAIEALAIEKQMDFMQAEEKVIGYSHTTVGEKVAEKWNLPERLSKVIRYHHKPSELIGTNASDEDILFVTVVHIADVFTMMLGAGIGADGMMYSLDVKALEYSGIAADEDYFEMLISRMVDLNSVVKEMTSAF